jgi:predicted nucleic acid-binding protein
VDLEMLYSARGPVEYDVILAERRYLPEVLTTPPVFDRAIEVQRQLARRGRHRLPITDLVIAATAESAGLTVLHYDADFERIARVTKQTHEWVARRGSL